MQLFFAKPDESGGTATAEAPPERAAEVAKDVERAGNPYWEPDEEALDSGDVEKMVSETLAENRERHKAEGAETVDHGDHKVRPKHQRKKATEAKEVTEKASDEEKDPPLPESDKKDEDEPPKDRPTLDPDAVAIAREIGMDDAELGEYENTEQLLRTLRALAKRAPKTEQPAKADAAESKKTSEAPKVDLGDEELNEQVNGLFKSMHDEIQALKESRHSDVEQRERDAFEAHTARFETAVRNLGEDWQDIYGTGDVRNLKRGGAKHTARREAYTVYSALEQILPGKTTQELVDMTNRALHGDHTEKLFRQRLSADVEKQAKGATPVPRGKPDGQPLTSQDRLRAIHDKYATADDD